MNKGEGDLGTVGKVFALIVALAIGFYLYITFISKDKSPASVLSVTADNLVNMVKTKGEQWTKPAVEEGKQLLIDTATKSAGSAKDAVNKTAAEAIVDQLDKLPEGQKEEIKKQICQ